MHRYFPFLVQSYLPKSVHICFLVTYRYCCLQPSQNRQAIDKNRTCKTTASTKGKTQNSGLTPLFISYYKNKNKAWDSYVEKLANALLFWYLC